MGLNTQDRGERGGTLKTTEEKIKDIAARLRKIRELKGMTREKFCEPLGVNSDYWGLIERGEQPISLVKLLQACEMYGIPLEDVVLLDYEAEDNTQLIAEISGLLEQCTERQLEAIKKFIAEIMMIL